jgi:hypothetical protein
MNWLHVLGKNWLHVLGKNWLRVLGTPELPQIDQGVRQQFHAPMSLLNMFKTE